MSFSGIHGLKGYAKIERAEWEGCSKVRLDEWKGPWSDSVEYKGY